MDPEAARRLQVRRKILKVLGGLLVAFLVVTCTPLGLLIGFPSSIWWAQRGNRREFRSHEARYRELAALVKRDIGGIKPGQTLFYRLDPGMEVGTLQRLDPRLEDWEFNRMVSEGILVEAHRYPNELGVRFISRTLWGGGSFSLIYWDPAPHGDLIWGGTPWCDLQQVDWLDGQWWNAYQPAEVTRMWSRQERFGEDPPLH